MSHSLVDAITITDRGWGAAAQEIASRRHVPLQAEMGGNNGPSSGSIPTCLECARLRTER